MSGTALSAAMMKAYKEGLGVDFALVCQGVTKHVHSQVLCVILDATFTKPILPQVIMARSPYIEAKVNRWCKEKKELVIDDCDPATFDIIVDYMYGSPIPDSVVTSASDNSSLTKEDLNNSASLQKYFSGKLERLMKLLQMSDMMQMVDLKGDVEELMIKNLEDTWSNWVGGSVITDWAVTDGAVAKASVLIDPAMQYNCEKLLLACARKWYRFYAGQNDLDMPESTAIIETMPKFAAALLVAFAEAS